jgi:transposase-like protein
VIFLNALRVKVRDESVVKNKAVYLSLALDCEGQKHVLGLWIEQSEGAKFWLRIMNELKTRGVDDIIIIIDRSYTIKRTLSSHFLKSDIKLSDIHLHSDHHLVMSAALSEGCRTKAQKLFKALTEERPCLRVYKTRRHAPFKNIDPLLRSCF